MTYTKVSSFQRALSSWQILGMSPSHQWLALGFTYLRAILHDEAAYHDPLVFAPERYFKDGTWDPTVRDPGVAAFGFGRRICPGRFMAKDSMWIAIASTLATFNFNKAKDEHGTPITPPEAYVEGFLW